MSGLAVTPLDVPSFAPTPPPPTLATFADNLYDALEPVAWQDAFYGYALAHYCASLGAMFQPVEDLARDTEDGPGWSAVLDLDRCPDAWLPWLAQFVGVTIPAGLTPAEQRAWITGTDGFARGTPAAIRNAAAATLTSSKTVVLRERDTSPYRLEVVTYEAETPDPAATQRAILAQKPAGIVLSYRVQAGADFQGVKAHFATYAALRSAYPTYRAARDTPLS